METQEKKAPLVIPVDPEHGALRFGVFGLFVLIWIITYSVVNLIIPASAINVLGILISFGVGFLVADLSERFLKKRWPSGRTVQVNDTGVQIMEKGGVRQEIAINEDAQFLTWRFEIKKRARVPKGWWMVACALEREHDYLPVYTFMSPDDFKAFTPGTHFTALIRPSTTLQSGVDDLRIAGEQRRLLIAEKQRWMEGAEMSPQDFQTYLQDLQIRFPALVNLS